jgi:hypothetical protein
MKLKTLTRIAGGVAMVCLLARAEDFRTYPGAKLDSQLSHQASSPRAQCRVYTTDDSFDRVYAYYKGQYKEFPWKLPKPQLPSGKQLQWAYFILDGAPDLAHSKHWLKIQRPMAMTADVERLELKDIRDVSVIQTVDRD